MLWVSMELWPGGDRCRGHVLAAVAIARVGEGEGGKARYVALTRRLHGPDLGAELLHVPRHGPIELVRHALDASSTDGANAIPSQTRARLNQVLGSTTTW